MDGLSVASNIAGIVSLANTIFNHTYRYAKSVKHAKKEIEALATGIRNLSSLLHGLNLVLLELEDEAGELTPSISAEFRVHHVSACLSTLTTIQKKIDKYQPEGDDQQ